jgi:serine/threonine protein kinase/WD40 repeat protein
MSNVENDAEAADASVPPILAKFLVDYELAKAHGLEIVAEKPAVHCESAREELACIDMMHRVWPGELGAPEFEAFASSTLGDFRIIRMLGRGGMGEVYEAEQQSMFRRVALKILPFAGLAHEKSLQRFRNEVRAAAALDHPHIVAVYSVGEERGVHYYAMQLIRGQSLAQLIAQMRERAVAAGELRSINGTEGCAASQPVSTRVNQQARISTLRDSRPAAEHFRTAALLGIQAAEALQHAHDMSVLHRDIKPSNLLLSSDGKLYVTDFGLARIGAEAGVTMTGDIVGTLRYMAPEQALGKHVIIDQRADIYSLGATLYELLALHPPFGEIDGAELLKQISFEEPPPLRKLNDRIPVELETIIAKAMAKQREERYQSAQSLSDDLQAYLDFRPIRAKPPTLANRVAKWARRRQTLMLFTAASLMLLSMILSISIVLINGARREAISALEQKSSLLYMSDMADAFEAWEKGAEYEAYQILQRQEPVRGGRDHRGLEWQLLWSLVRPPSPRLELIGHDGPVWEAAAFPDGRRLASVGEDGALRLWDAQDGTLLKTIELGDAPLYSVAVSRSGRYVAAASTIVYLCDVERQFETREIFRHGSNAESLDFGPSEDFVAAGFRYHEFCLVALDGKVIRRVPSGARLESLEFMPQRKLLLAPNRRPPEEPELIGSGYVQIWNEYCTQVHDEIDLPEITLARASPSENIVAAGKHRHAHFVLYKLETKRVVGESPKARANLNDLAFSPDGREIAAGYQDGILEIWSVDASESGTSLGPRKRIIKAHASGLTCVRFLQNGALATCGDDGFIRIWPGLEEPNVTSTVRAFNSSGPRTLAWDKAPRTEPHGLALSPDGSLLLYSCRRGMFIYDIKSSRLSELHEISSGPPNSSAWSSSGERIAFCMPDRTAVEIANPPKLLFYIRQDEPLKAVRFSPDDRLIAAVSDKFLQLYRGDDGFKSDQYSLPGYGSAIAFSPDGTQLACGGGFEGVVVVDPEKRRPISKLSGGWNSECLAFSPDGAWLAAGQADGLICLWNVRTGELHAELTGHQKLVREIAFSPDGRTLISTSNDHTVRLWSVDHARPFGSLYGSFSGGLTNFHLCVSADGRHLAISHDDSRRQPSVELWTIERGL